MIFRSYLIKWTYHAAVMLELLTKGENLRIRTMLFFWFPESFTVHLRKFCSIMPGFLPCTKWSQDKKMVLPYKWQTWSNGIANNTFVKVFKSSFLRKYHLRAKFSLHSILKRHICLHLYLLFARYSRNFSRKSFKFQRCCYYHKSFFMIHAVICVCCCLFINAMLWSTRCVALVKFWNFVGMVCRSLSYNMREFEIYVKSKLL